MAVHITAHRTGFEAGLNEITSVDESDDATGIGMAILKLAPGERTTFVSTRETAWLSMDGEVAVNAGAASARWARRSLFDERPS